MRRFTAILLSISLFVLPSFAVQLCIPVGAGPREFEEANGVELALDEASIPYTRSFNCTKVTVFYQQNALEVESLLPSTEEEVAQLLSLIEGSNVAIVYPERMSYWIPKIKGKLEGRSVVFEYPYVEGKSNYSDILGALIKIKESGIHIDTVIFLGRYREAILIIPFFRIFKPFPVIAATWRIYDSLMFAYRSFMRTVVFYEWFYPWVPLIHVREFVIKYLKQFGHLPGRFAALGYDAGSLVAKAFEEGALVGDVSIIGVTGLKRVTPLGPFRVYKLVRLKDLPHLPPPLKIQVKW